MTDVLHTEMLRRLRADPIPSTVPASLPVLFFGDLYTARIATIGINPSRQEFLSPSGVELEGSSRRFETLPSVGAPNRGALTEAQARRAVERMRAYYDSGKPVYAWFNGLIRVVEGMGYSFTERTAAHLDLVQEATDPVWSGLAGVDRGQAAAVLKRDTPFLRWQIETFPLRAVVCTSARVLREVRAMLGAAPVADGAMARVRWSVAVAHTACGPFGVAVWNIPLARPTGLDRNGHRELGELLAARLAEAGCAL